MRVNKILVLLQIADSRRKADLLIKRGEIQDKNGNILDLNYQCFQTMELIYQNKIYKFNPNDQEVTKIILLNKPIGYTCSHVNQNDFTIFNLLPREYKNFKIGGRLDKNSSGLVLLSNNGNFINSLVHPSQKKIKSYLVKINQKLSNLDQQKLLEGVKLDNKIAKFFTIKDLGNLCYEIELITGLNQQIRKSFNLLGYQVLSLHRTRIDKFKLDKIATGEYTII